MNVHLEGGMGATLLLGSRCPQQAPNAQQLRDLDGVGRGPLAEVVPHDPEFQAALVGGAAGYAPDEDVVAARHVDGGRVDRVGGVVHHDNAGRLGEQLPALVGREGLAGLDVGRHGMAGVDRDARAGGGDGELRPAEDLARLEHALALLGRVVVALLEGLHLRQDVESDLVRVDGRRGQLVRLDHGLGLTVQLFDGALTGARHGLVGGHDHPLDAHAAEDRGQRHDRLHCGAVRVGVDAAMVPEGVGVDLGHHERHVLGHAPLGGGGAYDGDPHASGTLGRWSPATSSGRTASAPSSKAVCSWRTAVSTCSSRTTQEILIGEVEIISMLTSASPSTVRARAATPGWLFIPAPTSETFPMCSSVWMPPKPSSAWNGSSASRAATRSSRGTVTDMSARCPSLRGSFWMIMSTFTLAPASAVSTRPAMPGRSGRPMRVMRASEVECVTAVTIGRSIVNSSSWTTVPGAPSKLDRQWIVTPWFLAYSTERSCRTPAPEAAISSISSKVRTGSLRASGTIRGSALNTPATSVKISHTSAPSAAASATAVVSEPPRPSVVTSSDCCDTP